MTSQTLCRIMRAAVIALAVCALFACCYIMPTIGTGIARENPEYAYCYIPWLVFLLLASAPCFAILALIWMAASAIGQERVFTLRTAHLVKAGSLMMLCDVVFFFAGNAVFLLLNMSHPGVFLVSVFVNIFGIALAVAAAILARYITKAQALQEEADGTI